MSDSLNIALIQSPIHWHDPEKNKQSFSKKIDEISGEIDLIVLPEMFSSGFTMSPNELPKDDGLKTLNWMESKAQEKNTAIVGSVSYYEDNHYYNRLFFVTPDGILGQYDKRHTFTFAGEDKVYRAGKSKSMVLYKGFKICSLICYDLRFPVWARNTESYDILLYVANWPKPRINAWDCLLKARAIENMSYCIGVNRVGSDPNKHAYPGHSAVYDALGNSLVFSEEETTLYATLYKEHLQTTRQKFQFLADSDTFTLKV